MPRAHRHFLPDYVWHITHRCHKQEFLLKFVRDRTRWQHWLFEAKKRYGLCVLNYIATSNHIHLLVRDQGKGEISRSMQLIAGRIGKEYNQRKGRKGAFWEDRYHATAVDSDKHLARCLTYIDLNMVRAGAVQHPRDWKVSGFHEMSTVPKRYGITDQATLMTLLGLSSPSQLQIARSLWVEEALTSSILAREPAWSDSLAVGSPDFVAQVQADLGVDARYRTSNEEGDIHCLRESEGREYSVDFGTKMGILSP